MNEAILFRDAIKPMRSTSHKDFAADFLARTAFRKLIMQWV